MDSSKDYYAILGVLPSIDQAALGAVYRALMKKYHPDVFSGSKTDAERISKELNEAYGVLGDAGSRASYDITRKAKNANAGDYESQNTWDTDSDSAKDEAIERDWEIVVRYHPDAEWERMKLVAISRTLAFAFQMSIIEAKSANSANAISTRMKKEFLTRYFGSNLGIQDFVLQAIAANRQDVVREVNRAIKVLGTPDINLTMPFLDTVSASCNWINPTVGSYGNSQETKIAIILLVTGIMLIALIIISGA